MNTVQKKTVIVTGGANGIGFHCCRELLRNGAKTVAIFDLPNMNGDASASKLNSEFGAGRALFFPADVAQLDKLPVVFKSAVEALGGLDILINNAGIFNDTDWQKEIRINFMAVVKLTLLAYDYMGTHKGGKGGIVANMSSILGLVIDSNAAVYTATKHAVLSFTVSLKVFVCTGKRKVSSKTDVISASDETFLLRGHFERTGVSVRVMCPAGSDTALTAAIENRCLDIVDKAEAARGRRGWSVQPCEYVGRAMVELIEKGANGAVWISQVSEPPFEVQLPKYECIKY